jgi:tellurite resistance protein TerC
MTGHLPPGAPAWFWVAFNAFVVGLLLVDLGVFQRHPHAMRKREAAARVAAMVVLALIFNAWVFYAWGRQRGLEFLTGYLIEYSLSVDNVFVFIVVLNYFHVSKAHQHRVLFWGILSALVMRGVFIAAGAALLYRFSWIGYVFGAFLIFTGFRLLRTSEHQVHPERNPVVGFFRRFVPMTSDYREARFWVKDQGRWLATPLLLVLVVIEVTDILFAVDSIPAIFAVTRDPFIVYTSNVFAILGLRALYFLLAGVMDELRHLKTGLAFVLMFVGFKMTSEPWLHIPIGLSLGVIAGILGLSVAVSLWEQRRADAAGRE